MNKKTLLIITDGIGHNSSCDFNAFCNANKPTYDYLFKNVPYSLIHTYGEHVGLPANQMGNSEVGHMTIGSGRVLYQDLVKIHLAIKNDTLKENEVIKKTILDSNNIHLIGLVSDGGVHSHIDHIIALAKISESFGKKVWLHLITDGRDVAPDSSKKYIKQITDICNENIQIATISGRYYAMDRDNRWERVEKAYNVIANAESKTNLDVFTLIENSYKNEIFDEFILPSSFESYNGINDNDGLIFCNFRSDRARELSSCFAKNDFKEFDIKKLSVNIASMTEYDKNVKIPVAFPKDNPKNTLAEVISNAGLSQVHTAETEKYAHVTFFFNGGVEEPFLNETRVLIPSPNVATYDLQPEMSAPKVGVAVRTAMQNNTDFIVVNFANGDMVGHTGVYEAAIKAVEAVDYELGLIIEEAKKSNYNVVLTSDHGNCEMMKDENGNILTNHTVGDVYCFVLAENIKKVKEGSLNNIAPTILKLMNLPIPEEMDEALI
ncbi:2,3-bisphosphoglycerate-independent phosphoglycerate mutase [Arcobacter porcinus]|uniref:2,3-bisphosphoglycerate-independent phosphoglycerate mutase n=1 Tax=Arcobacter porcinus TaxID=1935204 RepID=A0ABX2YDP7_9BACT|nr:2,3-bisphosphoglycerate-independent phosphoglycerate mutase [Arcobacter porcinus]OCL83583.1 2,3-bisphosphoglycerate-independent phosphoglycerate mutase [Arcobacter porcinus]OCL83802.1 2,3-bisphosphoglycerate-independent phosphoglycerate mutase [Arcobacter porcinus]OCL92795.1 2,3-bisphosphoglycerate-independent phosphoglycerate mutase [Arcobacter porcinus]